MENATFHLNADFEIEVGNEKKKVVIPRLKFRAAKRILEMISDIISVDRINALKVLTAIKDTKKDGEKKESVADIAAAALRSTLVTNNSENVENLLKEISGGMITDALIEEMQFGELVDMTCHLVNENFASLKNLSASLQAINSSGK